MDRRFKPPTEEGLRRYGSFGHVASSVISRIHDMIIVVSGAVRASRLRSASLAVCRSGSAKAPHTKMVSRRLTVCWRDMEGQQRGQSCDCSDTTSQ